MHEERLRTGVRASCSAWILVGLLSICGCGGGGGGGDGDGDGGLDGDGGGNDGGDAGSPESPLSYDEIRGVNFMQPVLRSWIHQWGDYEYDPIATEAGMEEAEDLGANLVMVFLEGDPAELDSLGGDYGQADYRASMLANLDDLLARAEAHGLVVLVQLGTGCQPAAAGVDFASDWIPFVLETEPYRFAEDRRIWGWEIQVEADPDKCAGVGFCEWVATMTATIHALDAHHAVGVEYFGNTEADLERNIPMCNDPGIDWVGLSLNWPDAVAEADMSAHLSSARRMVDETLGPDKGLIITQTGSPTSFGWWSADTLNEEVWVQDGPIEICDWGSCFDNQHFTLSPEADPGPALAISTAGSWSSAVADVKVMPSRSPADTSAFWGLVSEDELGPARFAGFLASSGGVECFYGEEGQPDQTACPLQPEPTSEQEARTRYLLDLGYSEAYVREAETLEETCSDGCGEDLVCIADCIFRWAVSHRDGEQRSVFAQLADIDAGSTTFVRGSTYQVLWTDTTIIWVRNSDVIGMVSDFDPGTEPLHLVLLADGRALSVWNAALGPAGASEHENISETWQRQDLENVISAAKATGVGHLIWELEDPTWCSDQLNDSERFWGLVRADGSTKPAWDAVNMLWR